MKWITIVRTMHRYWKMAHDPRTPVFVRYMIYAGILYTLSPVDLLPDFVPGLGLLDEAAILPGIIALATIFIPRTVKDSHDLKEHREIEQSQREGEIARVTDPEPVLPAKAAKLS